jgi:hypothetical protein
MSCNQYYNLLTSTAKKTAKNIRLCAYYQIVGRTGLVLMVSLYSGVLNCARGAHGIAKGAHGC